MTSITNIDELTVIEQNIVKKPKSRIAAIVIALVGVAAIAYALTIKEQSDTSTILLSAGFILVVCGVIKAIRPGNHLVYLPTGETVHCKKMLFDPKERLKLEACLRGGRFKEIESFSSSQSAALMSVVYTTHSGSCSIAQLYEYVPYQYEPASEPFIFVKTA